MQFGMEAVDQNGVGDWHLITDPSCWIAGVSMAEQPASLRNFVDRHHFNMYCQNPDMQKWLLHNFGSHMAKRFCEAVF
jgi:hypothetical protein